MSKFMSKAEGAELGIVITRPATRACFHPLSCQRCDRAGVACGKHYVGDVGHERCKGVIA